jgi:hypothetical protein
MGKNKSHRWGDMQMKRRKETLKKIQQNDKN